MAIEGNQYLATQCTSCIYSPICLYWTMRSSVAGECELMESPEAANPCERSIYPQTPAGGQLKGLCVNCESRHSCTLPKVDSGVWHCEKYR